VSITVEERSRLLSELAVGHDLLAACHRAQVDVDLVRSDADLLNKAESTFEAATSGFRSQLTAKCVKGGPADITTLARIVEDRRALQREQFKPVVAQHGGPDWSKYSVDQLLIYEAILQGDFGRVDAWVEQRARVLAADALRRQRRREAAKPEPISGEVLPMETLDPWQAVGRDRAVVPFRGGRHRR
jgi:hypothetical protein